MITRNKMTMIATACVIICLAVTEAAYTDLGTVYADKDG